MHGTQLDHCCTVKSQIHIIMQRVQNITYTAKCWFILNLS
jgi:hypothetical protein